MVPADWGWGRSIKTKRWITNRGYVLTFVLVILWPILSIPAQVFSKGYFAFWIVISIGWAFAAGITITIMPLWESQTEIIRVFSGIMNYCMGKSGNAAEYAEETAPAKTVEEPAAKAAEEEEVDAEFAEMLKA